MHAEAHRISEVSVERHAGRQSDGIIRIESHDQRGGGRGDASGEDHAFSGHPGLRQDLRIYDHDVSHREKRRKPTDQFAADGRLVFSKMKIALDQRSPFSSRWRSRLI